MSRPARDRSDLDYKVLHRTGERVSKNRIENLNMDNLHAKAIDALVNCTSY